MAVQITPERLQEKGACEDQRDLFAEHFPNGIEFESQEQAIEMCVKFADLFDFGWAADELLDADARAEFYRAKTHARAEYIKATAHAWAEFEKAKAYAWAEFKKAKAPAWAELKKAKAYAWAEFKKVQALAFAKAYWQQES